MRTQYLLAALLILPSPLIIADPKQNVEGVFATALILGDDDAITLGVANFDPVKIFDLPTSDIITAESIELRNQLSVYSIPYSVKLVENETFQDKIKFAISYVKQEQDQIINDTNTDHNRDDILSINATYQRNWFVTPNWTTSASLGNYLMTYQNKHSYSTESAQIQDQLNGQYYNIRSNAFLFEPAIQAAYTKQQRWGKWVYRSSFSAFYGWTFSGDEAVRGANPSGWEWYNGMKGYFNLHADNYAAESFYLKAGRIDIGGDVRPTFNTSEYYEMGLGILFASPYFQGWIDNIGVGINVNLGSSLSGGSVVIYLNE